MKANGGNPLIKITKICEFLGDSNQTRVKYRYLMGLEKIGRCYFIPDVAAALRERSTFEM